MAKFLPFLLPQTSVSGRLLKIYHSNPNMLAYIEFRDIDMRNFDLGKIFFVDGATSFVARDIKITNTTSLLGFDVSSIDDVNCTSIEITGSVIPNVASFSAWESSAKKTYSNGHTRRLSLSRNK